MTDILILNGPNLNLLGVREPGFYGIMKLADIQSHMETLVKPEQTALSFFQSNAEDKLIDRIHQAFHEKTDYILFNPAAFTHTSIALRDALTATKIPFIEVHLSNIHAREAFRHHSYFSDIADGVISGLGPYGYELALKAALHFLTNSKKVNNGHS